MLCPNSGTARTADAAGARAGMLAPVRRTVTLMGMHHLELMDCLYDEIL